MGGRDRGGGAWLHPPIGPPTLKSLHLLPTICSSVYSANTVACHVLGTGPAGPVPVLTDSQRLKVTAETGAGDRELPPSGCTGQARPLGVISPRTQGPTPTRG